MHVANVFKIKRRIRRVKRDLWFSDVGHSTANFQTQSTGAAIIVVIYSGSKIELHETLKNGSFSGCARWIVGPSIVLCIPFKIGGIDDALEESCFYTGT